MNFLLWKKSEQFGVHMKRKEIFELYWTISESEFSSQLAGMAEISQGSQTFDTGI